MNTQLHILTSLRRVHPNMMPIGTLWAEVRMASMPQPTRSDFDHALRELEDEKRQVIVTKTDDRELVKITAAGIARHEEAQS